MGSSSVCSGLARPVAERCQKSPGLDAERFLIPVIIGLSTICGSCSNVGFCLMSIDLSTLSECGLGRIL